MSLNDPEPVIRLHCPLPVNGTFANNESLPAHNVLSLPATAAVGIESTWITTVSNDDGHTPLDILHSKIFTGDVIPVTALVGEVVLETIPLPDNTDHTPFPVSGTLAFSEEEELQVS